MSEETAAQSAVAQPAEAAPATTVESTTSDSVAPTSDAKSIDNKESALTTDTAQTKEESSGEKTVDAEESASASAETALAPAPSDEKPAENDVDMADRPAEETNQPDADAKVDSEKAAGPDDVENKATTGAAEGAAAETESATTGDKSKARRKSSGDAKAKKLNKKASKAKILHVDAQPGEHYFAKLKGFPPWPVIIAEEDMLPQSMLSTRPVTAARPDGTYREDFADGGKRIADRTFPVMYLYTNEFSWTTNSDLSELDPSVVTSLITSKMRKDLQNAHRLAAEQNNLEYYKSVLREFEEQRIAKLEAKKTKKQSKKAAKAAEAAPADEDDDMDVEMADIEEPAEAEPAEKKPKSKKRKADDESNTPQRSESVKKPKIKLTNSSTPKASNGVESPTTKDSKPVKVKAKSKGGKDKGDSKKEKEVVVPKEPELSPEERRMRKEKEIFFLRHRLQKGLLLRDQEPKEEEMKSMSEFLAKLETFPDLEVSIIRATKINKVLKAILKLENIPKEDEFQFKPRSQTLLDTWNKLLATNESAAPASTANGVNGSAGDAAKSGKGANGVKESSADHKADPEKEDDEKIDAPEKDEEETKEEPEDEKLDSVKDAKASADEAAAEVDSTA